MGFLDKLGLKSKASSKPQITAILPQEIYEAMLTGPQNMPVFSNAQLDTEAKQHIIKYVTTLQESPNPGGLSLGRFGPVTEGVFLATAVFAALIAAAVWIGIKSR